MLTEHGSVMRCLIFQRTDKDKTMIILNNRLDYSEHNIVQYLKIDSCGSSDLKLIRWDGSTKEGIRNDQRRISQ